MMQPAGHFLDVLPALTCMLNVFSSCADYRVRVRAASWEATRPDRCGEVIVRDRGQLPTPYQVERGTTPCPLQQEHFSHSSSESK
jgi:hypothetical protein